MNANNPTDAQRKAERDLRDARVLFTNYLTLTRHWVRQIPQETGVFLYPSDTIESDSMVFASIFSCVWEAIKFPPIFRSYLAAKPDAFIELRKIINPNADGYAAHARFWVNNGSDTDVIECKGLTAECTRNLARTLRNGLNHFNYRYIDVTPSAYFDNLGLSLPPAMQSAAREPTLGGNYRIFVVDHGQAGFMRPNSDTRIVETLFAHLRYHLFCFLARILTEPGDAYVTDILTLSPLGPVPTLTAALPTVSARCARCGEVAPSA
ncbi:MAG: hypothetical protein KIT84_02110 [Labilithrix sp.]|nr:hypothetical protein [Labilithrix sp.]MCW5809783.1 hypothetical protein [Labilithrix sp.]